MAKMGQPILLTDEEFTNFERIVRPMLALLLRALPPGSKGAKTVNLASTGRPNGLAQQFMRLLGVQDAYVFIGRGFKEIPQR